jgi:hypothetical protein
VASKKFSLDGNECIYGGDLVDARQIERDSERVKSAAPQQGKYDGTRIATAS